MKKLEIMNVLNRKFGRVGFKIQKHSPEILVIAGVVGTVTSAIMACKATTKLGDILSESKNSIDSIHDAMEHPDELPEIYTKEDGKKDLAIVYTQTALKLTKLYAPSVILGGLSITAILTSNKILRKRNVALAAAYTAVDTGFKNYRHNVIERFGEDLDKELKYNIKAKTVEETITDDNGKKKKVKETVNTVGAIDGYSVYAKIYDDGCNGWTKDPEANLMFLRRQQDAANEILQSRGHLFLNDVYEMLGIHKTAAGQIVGWVYDKNQPIGDNYVDFGIYDINHAANCRFVNGLERTIVLDFNVDGPIYEML